MPGWALWLSYSKSKRAQTPPLAVDALPLDARERARIPPNAFTKPVGKTARPTRRTVRDRTWSNWGTEPFTSKTMPLRIATVPITTPIVSAT
jgi:hypothetical protein